MIHVKHRTASGVLSELWEFDPTRSCLAVVMRLGSAAPVAFEVYVCAPDRPTLLAHPIMRLDTSSWRVLPASFFADGMTGILFPHDDPIHVSIGLQTLVLTNSPPEVDLELEAL